MEAASDDGGDIEVFAYLAAECGIERMQRGESGVVPVRGVGNGEEGGGPVAIGGGEVGVHCLWKGAGEGGLGEGATFGVVDAIHFTGLGVTMD